MENTLGSTGNLLAGNAKFTILHNESGKRFTYWIITPKTGKDKGQIIARLLTGSDNNNDYTDIGTIDRSSGELTITGRVGSGETRDSLPESIALIRWFAVLAATDQPIPAGLTLHHAGKCLACGRTLTVPYPANPYRKFGLGPECGSK